MCGDVDWFILVYAGMKDVNGGQNRAHGFPRNIERNGV